MTLRLLALPLICVLGVAGCSKSAPTAPSTPAATPTKVIRLLGDLNFGGVGINQTPPDRTFTVSNDGTANLTVTGIAGPCGSTQTFVIGSTSFGVAPGGSVPVAVRYRPVTTTSCSGNIVVSSDATSGTGTIALSATGTLDGVPVFTRSGSGDNVFTLPSYVTKIRVDAAYPGSCQNFAVEVAGRLIVNIIIGTCSVADTRSPFTGTYAIAAGGQVAITISTGVSWTVTELR